MQVLSFVYQIKKSSSLPNKKESLAKSMVRSNSLIMKKKQKENYACSYKNNSIKNLSKDINETLNISIQEVNMRCKDDVIV